MSIHVTVNGNPVNIRRGRMVLSDLDQIKKNERDRRRRLRLEQVRQQSKEISNRLLERAKKIAREELNKLEKDDKSELKQMHDRKIMEIQQKYQEDLEDIGQAHVSAALQPNVNMILEEEAKRDRVMALKRGKEAAQHLKEIKQKDETNHLERLRKVREEENIRAAIISKLPMPPTISEENSKINSSQDNTSEEIYKIHETSTSTKKNNKVIPKKYLEKQKKIIKKTKKSYLKEHQKTLSPKPGPSGLQKQPIEKSHKMSPPKKADNIEHDNATDQLSRKTIPTISTMTTKAARYNPENYMQDTSDTSSISSNSSSSSTSSDDSSYFSDPSEQVTCNRTSKMVTDNKVQLYDHNTRQRNIYDRPLGLVERIDIRNEPNAIEAAQAVKDAENVKMHTIESRKSNAKRYSEDAILREKVRRDYKALMQNLDHLAQEERKLKASQIQSNAEENPHTRLYQRNKCQEEREKKLKRAVKEVLSTDTPAQYTHLTERVITLPTQKKDNVRSNVPHSTWQEPQPIEEETADVCYTPQDKDCKESREEQILDMLKRVERQKRLLLQEFGANLPDSIFNASIKSLFQDRTPAKAPAAVPAPTSASAPAQTADTARPLSPEIKVVNMSHCDGCVKKNRKTKKSDRLPIKKTEIAVQTVLDKTGPAEDKGIQVELNQENADVTHSSRDTARVLHPIEPQITVVTPETDDSSNDSTSSEIGMIIEIGKKEVTVTPKKRKSSVKVSKRLSPRIYQKIRSKSVSSKATSPIKKFSKSQLSSCASSPSKRTKCTDKPDVTSKRIDIHMSKSEFNEETDPSQETKVSIDASAESSQTFSGANDQEQDLESPRKPYRVRTQMKRWVRIKDTSDTSTSFASPPPVKPRSMFEALANITPILEMLDSSGPEELRRLRQDISPVSTPETPSPRTMRMPSNIPQRERISRILKYNSNDSRINDNGVLSSTQNDQSILTDPSDIRPQEPATLKPPQPSQVCTCKNPKCKLLHIKLDDIHDYALKNCPEILQKYEDLQTLCAERIASLTDLIERVRNEQKGMDFSLISPSDETSLMQLSISRPPRNDIQAMQQLIENIETVHSQLAKTLLESQRILRSKAVPENESPRDAQVQATTSTPRSKLVDTVTACIQESEIVEGKIKPKIVSDEKANIQLNRFKLQKKHQAVLATKMLERNSSPSHTFPLRDEEVIEKLSKEILEQSKNLNRPSNAFVTLKGNNENSMQCKISSPKDINLKNNVSLEHGRNNVIVKEDTPVKEVTKESSFIPTLADIPKVLRTHVTSGSARPKPPVTLLNGPHWQELESSGHELSTIIEFDTTDTVNKTIKSPTKIKNMSANAGEDSQKLLLKRASLDVEPFKSAITIKPSVHVAPLPVQQNQDFSEKTIDSTTDTKQSAEKLISVQRSKETSTIYSPPKKLKNVAESIATTKIETEQKWTDTTLEKYEQINKQSQCSTTTVGPTSHTKDKINFSTSTDFNNQYKNTLYKTTSTSLSSFSGLSGISEITSSPSSDFLKYASSPEEMETALKKLGLGWAVTTLKKTREASALSSSSNSDVTPINTARRMISPTKKLDPSNFPDISDVSSISMKEASKSTEQVVLLKGRTSTPKFQNSNSNSERSSTTNSSGSIQEQSDSLTVPNVSLTKTKSDIKQLQNP